MPRQLRLNLPAPVFESEPKTIFQVACWAEAMSAPPQACFQVSKGGGSASRLLGQPYLESGNLEP